MSEKNIEIKMNSTGVAIRMEHASASDVGLLLCTGVYNVCKELKIPIAVITATLNAADKALSTKENEEPVTAESKSEGADSNFLFDLIKELKEGNISANDFMTLVAIFNLHREANL